MVESTLPGAGYGLFRKAPNIVEEGGLLATYEGVRLTKDQMEQSKSGYIHEVPARDGTTMYVDAEKEDSCSIRYVNDPLDDSMVNAKVITKGERLVIIASTDIHEGDEVFISYGAHYWRDKTDRHTPDQAAQVREEVGAQENKESRDQAMISTPLERGEVELHAPGVRRAIVKSKLEQLTEEERERYVLDNVEQSDELAEELQ